MNTPALAPLASAERECFGRRPVTGRHALAGSALFEDGELADLLDHFPRHRLHALNMGVDPARSDENRVALHAGVTGVELLRAVRRGRLWLEITLALCVKLLLLIAIHHFWFSQPLSKHLTDQGVAAALFGPVSFPSPREERGDGSRP